MNVDPDRLLQAQGAAMAVAEEDVELWPEQWMAWQVFNGLGSQFKKDVVPLARGLVSYWSSPPYTVVEIVMRRFGVPEDEQDEVFGQYQVMEREALKVLNKAD